MASRFDLAIYPVLFVEFSSYFMPSLANNFWLSWALGVTFIWIFSDMNMLGSSVVGNSVKMFLFIVLLPFLLIIVIGVFQMDKNPVSPFKVPGGPIVPYVLFVVPALVIATAVYFTVLDEGLVADVGQCPVRLVGH